MSTPPELLRMLSRLRRTETFDEAARLLLAVLGALLRDALTVSDPRAKLQRAAFWRLVGDGYRDTVELDPNAKADIYAAFSTTALLGARHTREAVLLHAESGRLVLAQDGQPVVLGESGTLGVSPGSTVQVLKRGETTHLVALPVFDADNALGGLITLELRAPRFIERPLPGWDAFIATAAPYVEAMGPIVLLKPRGGEVKGEAEGLPVVGRAMQALLPILERFARLRDPILLTGPSGVGKTMLARWCHNHSPRRAAPFVSCILNTVGGEIAVAQLFGSTRGAYTGAVDRRGLIEEADGGTLFLDEIGILSPEHQQLLDVVETGNFRRLGETRVRHADVRLIVATNEDLNQARLSGRFRPDLYARLARLPVAVPPLSERADEIGGWATFMLRRKHERERCTGPVSIDDDALAFLQNQRWPDNLRELDSVVCMAWALASANDLARPVRVGMPELRWALLHRGTPAAPGLDQELRNAAVAFVDAALAPGPSKISLDDTEVFRAYVLQEAIRRLGPEEAFLRLGAAQVVRNRNAPREQRDAARRVEGFEERLRQR